MILDKNFLPHQLTTKRMSKLNSLLKLENKIVQFGVGVIDLNLDSEENIPRKNKLIK